MQRLTRITAIATMAIAATFTATAAASAGITWGGTDNHVTENTANLTQASNSPDVVWGAANDSMTAARPAGQGACTGNDSSWIHVYEISGAVDCIGYKGVYSVDLLSSGVSFGNNYGYITYDYEGVQHSDVYFDEGSLSEGTREFSVITIQITGWNS